MTAIVFRKNSTGDYTGFTCLGHAGANDFGKDIVCAAISILVITTVNSLEEIAKKNIVTIANEEDGLIDCRIQDEPDEKSQLLISSLVLGLSGISKEYGKKYLEVNFEEV